MSSISEIMGQGPLYPSSHPTIPSRIFGTDNGAIVSIAILGMFYFCVYRQSLFLFLARWISKMYLSSFSLDCARYYV